jgi:hypothetical protein
MNLSLMDGAFLRSPSSGPPDPFFSDVLCLLQAEGENGSTTAVDYGPLGCSVQLIGARALISTAESFDGGGKSFLLSDATMSATFPTAVAPIGTGPYTVEMNVRYVSKSYPEPRLYSSPNTGNDTSVNLCHYGLTNRLTLVNEDVRHFLSAALPSPNVWYNYAWSRDSSGLIRFYQDGVFITSSSEPQINLPSRVQYFGAGGLIAYYDNMRITRRARYTSNSNFTPSPVRYPRY